ncbi:hypothetical protein [Arenimonas donghaensis]|uniref:Lipoprotein n=1 Tax=Arenimonas donghaensis DSM 18148 = HO3-R19 TaxID=1121014 RepID=A0A087MJC2_9GAMM|nr:hypothetical protein [Arenimonas donghaensis]KFL36975.1 hypothetical protein N788_12060 [Arenimonas donghaensis DSM 18148 = HO3-R19]
MRAALLLSFTALVLAACSPAPQPPALVVDNATSPFPDAAEPEPAPAGETPDGQVPRSFSCRGNEPFWSLELGHQGGVLTEPGNETLLVGDLAATETGAWTFRGAPEDEPDAFTGAVLSPAQCFDTMANGPAMPYSAALHFADGRQGSGCCTVEFGLDLENAPSFDAAGKPDEDWSRWLPTLGPAVLRCAFDGGVVTEGASKAWPMNRGKAMVRLVDSGGDRFDCLVDLGSGDIETVQPVPAGDTVPGEDQPRWLPPGDQQPVLHCGRVERVETEGGLVTGWLHYTDGC